MREQPSVIIDWISVSHELPNYGEWVLVGQKGIVIGYVEYLDGKFYADTDFIECGCANLEREHTEVPGVRYWARVEPPETIE